MNVTRERVLELLKYDPETGVIVWAVSRGRLAKAGDVAGTIDKDGYTRININGRKYAAHRIAWLIDTGAWPPDEIDHRNGVRSDNRRSNLREADRFINNQNATKPNRRIGLAGVAPQGKRFAAKITINRRLTYIGTFDTPELAHSAYVAYKRKFHEGCTL